MNNHKQIISIALLVGLAVLVMFVFPKKDYSPSGDKDDSTDGQSNIVVVDEFNSCLEASGEILESFPRRCVYDGKTYTEDLNEYPEVVVDSPVRGQLVTSPMSVTGRARGNWFFEANLPITLKDQNGKILAQKGAQAQGDWMTTDYVNFSGVLEFAEPTTEFGVLLIEKDNPSGLPQNDSEFAIPVSFK